jgi:NADPH:quinone reductase-like Zn-dependent oxidoreductase
MLAHMETMRAVQFDRYGDPDVLRVRSIPRPSPAAGEIVVRVLVSSVNGHDLLARSGFLRLAMGRRFPMGTGIDFAGVVAARGDDVTLRVGAPVWGQLKVLTRHESGSAAEYAVVEARRVATPPPGISPAEAVSLVVPGPTAVRALCRSARLRGGESVLVRGAAGATGLALVQLAASLGGVVTTLSSERDFDRLRSFGAAETLDHRECGADELGSFDVIVDTVGRDLLAYRRHLARGGRMVAIAAESGSELCAVALSTIFGPRRLRTFSDNALAEDLDRVSTYVQQGVLRPVLGPSFTLDDIADAHRSLAAGGVTGKRTVFVDPLGEWP